MGCRYQYPATMQESWGCISDRATTFPISAGYGIYSTTPTVTIPYRAASRAWTEVFNIPKSISLDAGVSPVYVPPQDLSAVPPSFPVSF